jgi:hypothetical protein
MQLLKSQEMHHDSSTLGKFPGSAISVNEAAHNVGVQQACYPKHAHTHTHTHRIFI